MSAALPNPTPPTTGARDSVLSIPIFRKLWRAMAFSGFGDWLGLLATTALAQQLAGDDYSKANFAIAGVFIVRLLPAVFLGPIAGVIADRFDRRKLMITCDVLRCGLYISIPIVGNYFWLYTAAIIIETVTLFWSPAKEAMVPNLVPKEKLENANQVFLLAAYGTAPIAAVVFSILALVSTAITSAFNIKHGSAADYALYINALSFAICAITLYQLKDIPPNKKKVKGEPIAVRRSLLEGWKFVSESKLIRGLVFGMVGAFIAAGAVIGLARTFVGDLKAGDAAYGVLFGAVFAGLALGIAFGPRIFAQFSRRRLFGAALTAAGCLLILLALVQNLVLAIFIVVLLGAFSGISWVTGFTMLGLEVHDDVRGRTFAFIQSLIRIVLVAVLAIAPLIAAAIGEHTFNLQKVILTYNGASFTMLFAGVIATFVGLLSYQQMKDRPKISFWADIRSAFRGELGSITGATKHGLFIAFEGGEGSGKSTQAKLLKEWLIKNGESVLLSREPGGSKLGKEIRKILLSHSTGEISPRAEALLYAADRANHVYEIIRPALAAGDVVITDRYFDSSIAYQGAGRILESGEIARISRWATESLFPTLTIIIDLPAEIGIGRLKKLDRLEAQPLVFHERVRREFLEIALSDPERYFVIDGLQSVEAIHTSIISRVGEISNLKEIIKNSEGNAIMKPIRRAVKPVRSTACKTRSRKATQKKLAQ